MAVDPAERRRAGVLLHPTSLPGAQGNGRLGRESREFVDFLVSAGFSVWQMLPLAPRDEHGSPYASESAFAGDLGLLDPATLRQWQLIDALEHDRLYADPDAIYTLLPEISQRLRAPAHAALLAPMQAFRQQQGYWLEDYALYCCLRRTLGQPWTAWPSELRDREPRALARAREHCQERMEHCIVGQFLFQRQWETLAAYARAAGVMLFGDVPIFVAHDSADVWAHATDFQLDAEGRMRVETGVPPDYFSADGQLWGMPHYDWERMRAGGYRWWCARMRRQSALFDLLRIDHFRGLAAAWEVLAGAATARDGHWAAGPGLDLLEHLARELPRLALAAEDLGSITADVDELRQQAGLPGMRVFQFGFDGQPDNPHLPANYRADVIAYSGTHDNNTVMGWYGELDPHTRWLVNQVAGSDDPATICMSIKQRLLESAAMLTIFPAQDLLCLPADARMNTPGRATGNWRWRLQEIPAARVAQAHRVGIAASGRGPRT